LLICALVDTTVYFDRYADSDADDGSDDQTDDDYFGRQLLPFGKLSKSISCRLLWLRHALLAAWP
jgi:hypothetical protein